jgi:beta-N-acetylhexosaminidase
MIPVVFGLAGPTVSDAEADLFAAARPAGFILFGRNIVDPDQLRALTAHLRQMAGDNDLLIMTDQEGGRVARLRPPHWPDFPAGARFDALYDAAPATAMAAMRANAQAMAHSLRDIGITMTCAPMLDVRQGDSADVIGERALGAEPLRVAALGRAMLDGLRDGGVIGAIKHMPGHGRAVVDSHDAMPVVDATEGNLASDLAPFVALANAPAGLTAHVQFSVWDRDRPATLSAAIIADIIRGRIGFNGLLLTDDIGMHALTGPVEQRAIDALAAGVDIVLHCSGIFDEMAAIAGAVPPITNAAIARLATAKAWAKPPPGKPLSTGDALARRDALMASVAA